MYLKVYFFEIQKAFFPRKPLLNSSAEIFSNVEQFIGFASSMNVVHGGFKIKVEQTLDGHRQIDVPCTKYEQLKTFVQWKFYISLYASDVFRESILTYSFKQDNAASIDFFNGFITSLINQVCHCMSLEKCIFSTYLAQNQGKD